VFARSVLYVSRSLPHTLLQKWISFCYCIIRQEKIVSFVTGLYGKKNSGYKGIGIAFPQKKYKLMDVDIARYVCQMWSPFWYALYVCVLILFLDSDALRETFLPVSLDSLSGHRPSGWPRPPKPDNTGFFNRILTTFQNTVRRKQLEWNDPWNIAEFRNNVLVTLTLQDKET
jgi:hypothetical protein